MEKKVIRVGSVGLGAIWSGVHAPGIERSPDLQLTAVCDIDEQKLKEAGDKYGIDEAHRFTNYQDLVNCPDVDAVDNCTPNDVHFEVAMAAIEAGKPFTIEKPITLTSEDADVLAKAVQEKGIKHMVCFSYRFKAAARYARDLIAKGKIGRVYHVNIEYSQAWGLPRADCVRVWRYIKARTGSGALGDLGCHALDLVRFVTGKEYTKVVGHTGTYMHERRLPDGSGMGPVDVDDFCNYMAEMEEGVSVTFQISRFAFGRGNYQRMEIYGADGAIIYQLDATPGLDDEIFVCSGDINADAHVFNKLPVPQNYFADQMQCFADIVNGVSDGLPASIEDGRINQHIVDTILASAKAEKWMEIQ